MSIGGACSRTREQKELDPKLYDHNIAVDAIVSVQRLESDASADRMLAVKWDKSRAKLLEGATKRDAQAVEALNNVVRKTNTVCCTIKRCKVSLAGGTRVRGCRFAAPLLPPRTRVSC